MSTMNIGGLVSGLDTNTLIDQLMQIEKQPQTLLQNQKTSIQSTVDIYRSLNTKFLSVQTAAENLNSPLDWLSTTGTSSNTAVATVAATSTATPTALSFHVNNLAAGHALLSASTTTDPATTGTFSGPISITANGATTNITDVGDGSLNAVASAITGSGAPVTATVIHLSNGSFALQVASKTTGAASAFTVGGLDSLGPFSVLSQGTDASVTVGDPNGVHYDVSSATNTFSNLINGATVTVQQKGDASVLVSTDPNALADKVQALVTAVNDANSYIGQQSTYDATNKKAGPLLGDLTASNLSQSLIDAIISPLGNLGVSAASLGISVDRNGQVTFDKTKFVSAYQANPTQVAAAFQSNLTDTTQNGIAERLRVVANSATDVVSGSITSAINSRTTEMSTLDTAIADWNVRLTDKQNQLKAQFTAMETALSTLKNQSSWLAGQIASLGTG